MSDLSEKAFEAMLLLSAQAGDKLAAERLAARWHPRLLRTANRYLQDRELARDAVQDSWIAICAGWHSIRDPTRFPAWAFQVLRHKAADSIRWQKTKRARFADDDQTEAAQANRQEDLTALDQAFATLTPDLRLTATLFFGEGLDLVEISHATGVPVGTVKSRLHTARQRMKTLLSGE